MPYPSAAIQTPFMTTASPTSATGQAVRIPKHTDLIYEIHYTPNNRETTMDQSMVAFKWASQAPDEEVFATVFRKPIGRFRIPPHAHHYQIEDTYFFPRDVEIAFGDAFDKLLRATEGLDSSRDALAGVRDFLQGKIANDQNEIVKRLTVIASLLLVPTFIVGLYGQNFIHMPEYRWSFGYAWSWGWIIATTIAQLAYFRWKRWI